MAGMDQPLKSIVDGIARDGFALVRAPEMRDVLEPAGLRDWQGFAQSWGDLGGDAYMAGGRRRHPGPRLDGPGGGPPPRPHSPCPRPPAGGTSRKPHQPHYQSRDYNPL